MRYAGLALKFIGKNIFHLTFFTLLPAVALSFYYMNSSFFVFLKGIFSMETPQNSYFYYSIISGENWLFAIAAVFVIIVFTALTIAYIHRAMKVGGRSIIVPFRKVNETIVPVFLVLIIFLLLFQLFALFASLLVDILLVSSPTIYRVFIPVLLILIYTILLIIIMLLFMTIPIMIVTGYRFKESIAYSIKLISKRIFKFAFAVLVPLIVLMGFSLLINFLTDIEAIRIVFGAVSIWFILMYYPVLMMTSYYDITGMNRLDIKRKPIYFN